MMRSRCPLTLALAVLLLATRVAAAVESFFDLEAENIDGNVVEFDQFRGKVTIVVNVASECGYTDSHYGALVELYNKMMQLTDKFNILAFPCNQFGGQEPGTPAEIKKFTEEKGVEFMVMNKVDVNGPNTHPVYQFLKEIDDAEDEDDSGDEEYDIGWNFETYYIVGPEGGVDSYSDIDPPRILMSHVGRIFREFELEKDIAEELKVVDEEDEYDDEEEEYSGDEEEDDEDDEYEEDEEEDSGDEEEDEEEDSDDEDDDEDGDEVKSEL